MRNSIKSPTPRIERVGKSPALINVSKWLYRDTATQIYYGIVKVDGRQHKKSLRTTDRKLAERRVADFYRQVKGLRTGIARGEATFLELGKNWFEANKNRLKPRSAETLECNLKQLNLYFGSLSIRSICSGTCNDWEKWRGADISASTFNKERSALTRILSYAVREGLLLDNPATVLVHRKLPKRKIEIPSHSQFHQVVQTLRVANCRSWAGADLIELLAYSGMRITEATALTWGDIDFEQGRFAVTGGAAGTKNNEVRIVPLFPAMRTLLERLKQPGEPPREERVIPIKSTKKALATACKKLNLPKFHHHALRHYFVSNAIEAGVDFKTIANWVGHKDGGVLVAKTYGHLRDTHSYEMAKRMTFSAQQNQQPGAEATSPIVQLRSNPVGNTSDGGPTNFTAFPTQQAV